MTFFIFYLCLLNGVYAMTEEKCWRKGTYEFIQCSRKMDIILLKDVKLYNGTGYEVYYVSYMYMDFRNSLETVLSTCNGKHRCNATITELFHSLYPGRLCILFSCVPEQQRSYLSITDARKIARSNVFQAASFSGYLRCDMYGGISQITIFKSKASEILIRDKNGSEIIGIKNIYKGSFYGCDGYKYWDSFICTKKISIFGEVELNLYSENKKDIILMIEGVTLFQCRIPNAIVQQVLRYTSGKEIEKCRWKDYGFPLISTIVSIIASVVMTIGGIAFCIAWRKIQSKTTGELHEGKSIDQRTNPRRKRSYTDLRIHALTHNYETPETYMEVSL